eukprot:3209925-Ditylum_brightwellii.AAC.1
MFLCWLSCNVSKSLDCIPSFQLSATPFAMPYSRISSLINMLDYHVIIPYCVQQKEISIVAFALTSIW